VRQSSAIKLALSLPGCAAPALSISDWPAALSPNERPDSLCRTQHHVAGRPPLRCGAAGGHGSPQARGHRPTAPAGLDVPFDGSTTGGREVVIEITRQFQ